MGLLEKALKERRVTSPSNAPGGLYDRATQMKFRVGRSDSIRFRVIVRRIRGRFAGFALLGVP